MPSISTALTGTGHLKPPISLIHRSRMTLTGRRISNNALDDWIMFTNVLSSHREGFAFYKRFGIIYKEHSGQTKLIALILLRTCVSSPHHCADTFTTVIDELHANNCTGRS